MGVTLEQALQQGVAAHKAGKLQDAERLYRAILKSNPIHPDANHNLGVLAVSFNKAAAALPLFKTALKANPKIEQFWLSYIACLIKEQHFDEAKLALKQIKKLGMDREKLNPLGAQIVSIPAIKNTGNRCPSQNQLSSLLQHYQNRRFTDAEQLALSIIQEFPEHSFSWKVLGSTLKQTGRLSESLVISQKMLYLEPFDAEAHNNLGNTLEQLGRLEESQVSFTQAIVLEPNFPEAYFNLANTLRELGRFDQAGSSYSKTLALKPNYSSAKHLLAALTGEATVTAPQDYVEGLFDNYAAKFENSLVKNLGYKIPKVIAEMIINNNRCDFLGSMMDLGCGTGLFGVEIEQFCEYLEGIDLSEKMLGEAKKKGVYKKLVKGDILDYLSHENLNFDYFVATDVFIYIGDLSDIFRLIKTRNKVSGKLAFSTEHYDGDGFFLEQSGRYSHSRRYIEGLCRKFGYKLRHCETQTLRKDKNRYIRGAIYLLDF